MQLKEMENMDPRRTIQATNDDIEDEHEGWSNDRLRGSCKICQVFLQTLYFKNLYKRKLDQLKEESEQMVKTLTQSFEDAKNNFNMLFEEKLKLAEDIESYKPYITLLNQHSQIIIENANLQLEVKHLNELFDLINNEHGKQKAQLQSIITEQESTIEILNDNIHYFVNKLKFKKNPRDIIKRINFKRNIRRILSDNIRNVKLLTEKLETYEKNNLKYHYTKMNKQKQIIPKPSSFESGVFPTSSSNNKIESNHFDSLGSNKMAGEEVECHHSVILDQPLEEEGLSNNEYEESNPDVNLIIDSHQLQSDYEVSCNCDHLDYCQDDVVCLNHNTNTNINFSSGNMQNVIDSFITNYSTSCSTSYQSEIQAFPCSVLAKTNNRSKYSIICQQNNKPLESYNLVDDIHSSNGDAKQSIAVNKIGENLLAKKSPSTIISNTNDEISYCDCSDHCSQHSTIKDGEDFSQASSHSSSSYENYSRSTESGAFSFSEKSEASKASQTMKNISDQDIEMSPPIEKKHTALKIECTNTNKEGIKVELAEKHTSKLPQLCLTNTQQKSVEPGSLVDSKNRKMGEPRTKQSDPQECVQQTMRRNFLKACETQHIFEVRHDVNMIPCELFCKLPPNSQRGLPQGTSIHEPLKVREAASRDLARFKNNPGGITQSKVTDISVHFSRESLHPFSCNTASDSSNDSCDSSQHSQSLKDLTQNIDSEPDVKKSSTSTTIKRVNINLNLEKEDDLLFALDNSLAVTEYFEGLEADQFSESYPLRTESAPGMLETSAYQDIS